MSRIESIEAMQLGLNDSVARNEWQRARRYIDRLRGIILDGLVQDDPGAIRRAGAALRQTGERLELLGELPMVMDQTAFAWQLRADASIAALAARVRPLKEEIGHADLATIDVPALLIRTLNLANGPMSNASLAARTGKDPAVVSRTLKRLERDGRVRRWRGPNAQQLNASVATEEEKPEQQNHQRFFVDTISNADEIKGNTLQPMRFASQKLNEIILENKKPRYIEERGA